MDIANCLSLTSSVTANPLKTDSNVTALKTFEDIIRTSIGPRAKLKVVQNIAGGPATVTSSSQRLLNIVSIQNIFLKMIVASAKTHLSNFGDNGLSCLLLTLKLINNSLSLQHPSPLMGKLYECFGKIFVDCMKVDKNACLMTLDLSSVANYQSVVESVLSKPSCVLRPDDRKHLSILLIKAYLNCIPSNTSDFCSKNFNVITLEGVNCSESCLLDGLLIRLSEMPLRSLSALLNKSTIKIALFTISLSGDADFPVNNLEVSDDVCVWEVLLKSLKKIIENIIKSGIHILACQKVVHPSLRKLLEDANILVLDRLGYETSKYLGYLSGNILIHLFYVFPIFVFLCQSCKNYICNLLFSFQINELPEETQKVGDYLFSHVS